MSARKIFDAFSDVVRETANSKQRAAAARFKSSAVEGHAESPRDVFLEACSQIATVLESEGFRFAKSGPHLTKNAAGGVFKYRIAFQSSHNNVAGHHVMLWMHGNVYSVLLSEWRKRNLPQRLANDHVAGGMAHLLRGVHAMVEWELADAASRTSVIADAVEFIRGDVLPYFAQFGDPKAVVEALKERAIPAMWLIDQVEFAMCFGDQSDGQLVLDRFVREHHDLHGEIARVERDGFRHPGMPPSGYAEQVVFLLRNLGLQ